MHDKYIDLLGPLVTLPVMIYQMLAGDIQLYKNLNQKSVRDQFSVSSYVEECVSMVSIWMTSNGLKLDSSKTECIDFGSSKQQLSKI